MSQVIFDGECPVCTTLKELTEERTVSEPLEFIPYQSEALRIIAADLSQQEVSQALLVIAENGKRLRGARAVFEVMSQLLGFWGVIGKVLRIWPFYWLAEPFYRWFARNRHGISKILEN